ncbi:MAG TPA: Asp-tRNA(Asn)/Glu-tRNA(Gln) amidotransferase subunit GatB [Acidimicrobiales bacterium]|jgi:aspartyl-tRNA(Asn)/glutamyl-tRNA(Gln) amidotransferase subunit B|nr:Asp-tRNA(Asn)/Glu-tRNA(Gln) amidotransferase subunit GatB [Acidimicrobiales bacterium]
MSVPEDWEIVIGLEVHCELATTTKLFCGCPNLFGDEPNTNVCPVCLGLPGSLPVLNEKAVELALRLGQALHCAAKRGVFARKNYFYPDMPKDYQVSQYDMPTNVDGYLDLPDGARIGIERAHIEEDTGKNTHVGGGGRIHGAEYSLVDYNRAGIPLVEIVSRPDLRSADDARDCVNELRAILLATRVSDAKMEEGSMRVDANVSVRKRGDELGTRCEIKNLNSVRSLGRAIEYEASRQVDLITSGERVRQETRHWDEEAGRTRPGRSKEQAEDYRYFPEPDLVPLEPEADLVDHIVATMPALPNDRRQRLADAAGVTPNTSGVVVAVARGLDDLAFAAISERGDPARVLTHVEHNLAVDGADAVEPISLAKLTQLEVSGALTATQAKTVLAELVEHGGDPEAIANAKGFEEMDTSALDATVDEVIAAYADVWTKYVAGDDKAVQFLTGQVMRSTSGKADGKAVMAIFQERRRTSAH